MLHNLFLPLIALVSGIASLFIDPKSQPKRAWILVGLLIASVAGTTAAGVQDDDDQAKDKADLRSQITEVKETADRDKDEILKHSMTACFVLRPARLPMPPNSSRLPRPT